MARLQSVGHGKQLAGLSGRKAIAEGLLGGLARRRRDGVRGPDAAHPFGRFARWRIPARNVAAPGDAAPGEAWMVAWFSAPASRDVLLLTCRSLVPVPTIRFFIADAAGSPAPGELPP